MPRDNSLTTRQCVRFAGNTMKSLLTGYLLVLLYLSSTICAEEARPDGDQSAEALAREIILAGRERYRREQAEKRKVVMFATSWCGYCRRARAHFQKNGILYTEYDIEKNSQAKLEYDRLKGRGVPLIIVGEQVMRGFSVEHFDRIYRAIQ